VEAVPRLSLQTLREMATSRAIVTNAGMKIWMVKFDDQYYVQTWHGDRGFKKIYLDVDPNRRYYREEGPRIDLAVSGSPARDEDSYDDGGDAYEE
jgi:CDP-glycerol glycerophosphotransferase